MRLFTSFIVLASTTSVFAAPPEYVVKDLGTLAGPATKFEPGSFAAAVSPSGVVVGHSVTNLETRDFHAFRSYDPFAAAMADLGVLPTDKHSMAFAVNSAGDAVGVSYALGEISPHGARWPAGGGIVSLGNVEARDINDAGQIVGSQALAGAPGSTHAVRLDGGATTDLGTLGGQSSMAFAISESGWIVGQSFLADGTTVRAFVWRNGSLLALPALGGTLSAATDIRGLQAVGSAALANQRLHAVRWTLNAAGALVSTTDLGTLPGALSSSAFATNSSGVVVGVSGAHAFRHDGAMVDLNSRIAADSGWVLEKATGISDTGVIVGGGKRLGLARAFALVPRRPSDLDANGIVDAADLGLLLGAWGTTTAGFDLTGDGIIDAADLGVMLGDWG